MPSALVDSRALVARGRCRLRTRLSTRASVNGEDQRLDWAAGLAKTSLGEPRHETAQDGVTCIYGSSRGCLLSIQAEQSAKKPWRASERDRHHCASRAVQLG